MDRTDGHQLVMNEYYADCLREAKEQEAERDEHLRRVQDRDAAPYRRRLQPRCGGGDDVLVLTGTPDAL